ILRVAQLPVSLEKPVGDEVESELGDFVADDADLEPFEEASEHLQKEGVKKALEALPDRERQVIELRYGLAGKEPLTLAAVGRTSTSASGLAFRLSDQAGVFWLPALVLMTTKRSPSPR